MLYKINWFYNICITLFKKYEGTNIFLGFLKIAKL